MNNRKGRKSSLLKRMMIARVLLIGMAQGALALPLLNPASGHYDETVSQAFLDWAKPLIGGAVPESVALSE